MKLTTIALVAWTALICIFSGCGQSKVIPPTLDAFAEKIRQYCEAGDTDNLVKLVQSPGASNELNQAMKTSLSAFLAGRHFKVSEVTIQPFSDYQSTTGAPGNYNGRALKWAVKPSHWVVLKGTIPPPKPDSSVTTKITLEFATVQLDGNWQIAGAK